MDTKLASNATASLIWGGSDLVAVVGIVASVPISQTFRCIMFMLLQFVSVPLKVVVPRADIWGFA